jgi:hypothetical protein
MTSQKKFSYTESNIEEKYIAKQKLYPYSFSSQNFLKGERNLPIVEIEVRLCPETITDGVNVTVSLSMSVKVKVALPPEREAEVAPLKLLLGLLSSACIVTVFVALSMYLNKSRDSTRTVILLDVTVVEIGIDSGSMAIIYLFPVVKFVPTATSSI